MEGVRRWIEEAAYARALGVEAASLAEDRVELRLPYRDANSNPGQALHGGVAASLVAIAGQTVARAAHGRAAGPWHTAALQIGYLSAAIGEDVAVAATRLRRGKELTFAEVSVTAATGRPVAHGLVTVHARFGREAAKGTPCHGDDGASEPGRMGPHVERLPFLARLGIRIEHMDGARARIVLPYRPENSDEGGGVHEGALLALFDTTGAMAAWALTGPGRHKASTPGLQAQVLVPPPRDDLIGYGSVVMRDGALFWSRVEIAAAATRQLVARGTVVYRIVTSEKTGRG